MLTHQVAAADGAAAGMLPSAGSSTAGSLSGGSSASGSAASGRPRELLGNLQKYLNHVKQALQQLTGDVALPMPTSAIDSVAAAAKDPDIIDALQEVVLAWAQILADVMQREGEKLPDGRGPLAEIDFWRARSAVLCGLWEQLNTRTATNVVAAMEAGSDDLNLLSAFKAQLAELGKLAHEVCVRA